MPRLVLLSAIAVLLTADAAQAQAPCGGAFRPPCLVPIPPPPPPGPVPVTVTLTPEAVRRAVRESPRIATFSGVVSGVAEPRGIVVELRQSVPGYGAAGVLRTELTQVAADGSFAFSVAPTIGVVVRAVIRAGEAATGQSPVRLVTVRSMRSLSVRSRGRGRGRFTLTSVGPGRVPLASGDVAPLAGAARTGYLYVVSPSGRSARRIGAGRVRGGACAVLCKRSAIGFFQITRNVRRARTFFGCSRDPFFLAIDDPARLDACGRTEIALR